MAIRLKNLDKTSLTWRAIEDWARSELALAREALETPGIPVVDSDVLRGRISQLKALLAQADDVPPPAMQSDNFGLHTQAGHSF